jgi:hypothetical protein
MQQWVVPYPGLGKSDRNSSVDISHALVKALVDFVNLVSLSDHVKLSNPIMTNQNATLSKEQASEWFINMEKCCLLRIEPMQHKDMQW